MLAEITFTFSNLFGILQAFAKHFRIDLQLAPLVVFPIQTLAILRNFDSIQYSGTSSAGYSCQVRPLP